MSTLRCLLVAALLLMTPAPALAGPADLVTTAVAFTNDTGETLHGLVYAPRTAPRPLPGMVLLHGSGPGPHRTLATEAKAFAAQGIAVLAYDKRTVGYSDTHRDYPALAADAVDAVDMVRGRAGIDAAHVGVWGISEGGWVAPLAAARSDHVAFLVAASAPGLTPMRTENWNTRNKIHAAGVRGPLVGALSDRPLRLFEDAGTFAESRYDPRPTLAAVTQPVLAVYGDRDVQVPPAESAEVFRSAVRANLSIRVLPGADHLLKVEHPGQEDTAYPGYPELVGAWVRAVAAGGPPAPVVDPLPAQRVRSDDVSRSAPWERWPVQLAVFALIVLIPLSYPAGALLRRLRKRARPAHHAAADGPREDTGSAAPRTLAVLLPLTALGALAYLSIVLTGSDYRGIHPGPVLAGRPLGWLAVQLLCVATVLAAIATVRTLIRRRRARQADRIRLIILLGGAALFAPWAWYWGLLP